ncbi:MAG: mandelate racemase/muconate lactonizing enzyme family protein [Alphaproteobacteria bacterium]|nr:mandelate racemase/muconate lactonizing enzyme family protein [Alphaproteobacteria bacterium]
MKIVAIRSHVFRHPLTHELGYSQAYYSERTAHFVEVVTDEGLIGLGECFGAGTVALANRAIVERTLAPLLLGEDALARERLWHKVYNGLRDHGQKGLLLQALSGINIALWDIAGKAANLPLYRLLGGPCRQRIPVYGYGMMLRREAGLANSFADEARELVGLGFRALKMKIGLGPKPDLALATAVRQAIGDDIDLMVDANRCYTAREALPLGRELERLGVAWFEEPVANEDRQGYRDLAQALDMPIAGGEGEFTRWGFRDLLEGRCVDLVQPEVCGLGGISEYLKIVALAHAHFVPVVNHVWGSNLSVAVNLHLLAALPDLPGGIAPTPPMLEFDTTESRFRDAMLQRPLRILAQVRESGGSVGLPEGPGLGVELDWDYLRGYAVPA